MEFPTNLYVLEMDDPNIILGMDRLGRFKVMTYFGEQEVYVGTKGVKGHL